MKKKVRVRSGGGGVMVDVNEELKYFVKMQTLKKKKVGGGPVGNWGSGPGGGGGSGWLWIRN